MLCLLLLPLYFGEMIEFDENIFKLEWFNYRLVLVISMAMEHSRPSVSAF